MVTRYVGEYTYCECGLEVPSFFLSFFFFLPVSCSLNQQLGLGLNSIRKMALHPFRHQVSVWSTDTEARYGGIRYSNHLTRAATAIATNQVFSSARYLT